MNQHRYPVTSFSSGDGRLMHLLGRHLINTLKGISRYRLTDGIVLAIAISIFFTLDFLSGKGWDNYFFRLMDVFFAVGRPDAVSTLLTRLIVFDFFLQVKHKRFAFGIFINQMVLWTKAIAKTRWGIAFFGFFMSIVFSMLLTNGPKFENTFVLCLIGMYLIMAYDRFEGAILGFIQRFFALIRLPSGVLNHLVTGSIIGLVVYVPGTMFYSRVFEVTTSAPVFSFSEMRFVNGLFFILAGILQLSKLTPIESQGEKYILQIITPNGNQVRPGEAPLQMIASVLTLDKKGKETLHLALTNQLKITCNDPTVTLEINEISPQGQAFEFSVKADVPIENHKKIVLKFGFKNRVGYLSETHEVELIPYPTIALHHPHFYTLAGSGMSFELPFLLKHFKAIETPKISVLNISKALPFELTIDEKRSLIRALDAADLAQLDQPITFYPFELVADSGTVQAVSSFSVGVCKEGLWVDFLGEPPIVYPGEKTYVSAWITKWAPKALRLESKAPDLLVASFEEESEGFLKLEPSWQIQTNQPREEATYCAVTINHAPHVAEPLYGKLCLSSALENESFNIEVNIAAMPIKS